jgi:hypothetical protein
MDLKFRSDILGKSILFMGYSFNDINIRIIWYKLMRLMRDIPDEERPASYMVRFEPNAVLQQLYADVGIKTIYLDPEGKGGDAARGPLLSEFLNALASQSADKGRIRGSGKPLFVSKFVIDAAEGDSQRAGIYRD